MAQNASLGGIIAEINKTLAQIEEIEPETVKGSERRARLIDVLRGFRSALEELCAPQGPGELPQFHQIT